MSELSEAEKQLMRAKHERTMKLRHEYNKQISNPFRHASGEGGTLFDANIIRFQAMRVTNYEHFKPSGKNLIRGVFALIVPMCLYGWALKTERDGREHKYRTGQVAYKDRRFKFI